MAHLPVQKQAAYKHSIEPLESPRQAMGCWQLLPGNLHGPKLVMGAPMPPSLYHTQPIVTSQSHPVFGASFFCQEEGTWCNAAMKMPRVWWQA